MKIVIEKGDPSQPKDLGFSKMVSYPVYFRSAVFSGGARFVPASEDVTDYLQQEVVVEIGQERVGELRFSSGDQQHEVTPLNEAHAYHVRGEVYLVIFPSEPPGNRVTLVTVGDACFGLDRADLGDLLPVKGDTVEFNVYELSLWDEAL